MKSLLVSLACVSAVSLSVVGCSGSSKPAVCSSVDNLKTSVANLQNVNLTAGALSEIQTDLKDVQNNVTQVKSDAKSQFSQQINAVDSSYASLTKGVQAAQSSPSLTTITALAPAIQAFGTSVQTLVSDVQSTC